MAQPVGGRDEQPGLGLQHGQLPVDHRHCSHFSGVVFKISTGRRSNYGQDSLYLNSKNLNKILF
jgi:hypothetical protein